MLRKGLLRMVPALLAGCLLLGAGVSWAQEQAPAVAESPSAAPEAAMPKIDSGDTAWILTSSALVMAMTLPGLALFYGGMSRKKNALSTTCLQQYGESMR